MVHFFGFVMAIQSIEVSEDFAREKPAGGVRAGVRRVVRGLVGQGPE